MMIEPARATAHLYRSSPAPFRPPYLINKKPN